MDTSHYSCRRAITQSDLAAGLEIRNTVFVEEQGCPAEIENDEYDYVLRADHLIVYVGATPIATGRVRRYEGNIGKIQRVAVLRPYRRGGVGRVLMKELESVALQRGFTRVILDAQCTAQPFYETLGYRVISDMFYDAGIQHVRMEKKLSASL